MPRTAEQYENIRKEKKKAIMDVALELFANEGFHGTTISRIAKKAEISKGLMYNYFTSKEELLNAIIDEGFKELTDNFDLNKDNVLSEEEFIFFLDAMFKTLNEKRSFWLLYFSLLMQPALGTLIQDKLTKIYVPMLATMKSFFTDKGVGDPETEALLLGSLLDGIGLNYLMNPQLFPVENIKRMIIDKYIRPTKLEDN